MVKIEGVVTRGTTLHVADAIEAAEDRNAPLVLLLNTPGGLVDATLRIKGDIFSADVPVLAFVGPRGAFAESAGTFLLLMGHPSGMAPSTQIGSAQPIVQGASGQAENASAKVTNFLVGQIESIAERAERNQTLARHFVTQNLNMNASVALDTGMIDHLSDDLEAFVRAVHGQQAIVGSGQVTLDTQDAEIVVYEKGLLVKLIEIIGNPQVAFILFLVGLYGVIFGLAAPGTFVPETIGAILLVLALIGLGLFDTGTAGVLLILLGAAFFVAEVFTPTHGILTTAGVVSLVLGAIFLIEEPLLPAGFLRQFYVVSLVSAVLSGGAVMGAVYFALKTRGQPVAGELVGMEAVALSRLDPDGTVLVRGERWKAVARAGPIEEEETCIVVERDGLTLTVEPETVAPLEDTEPPS